MFQCPANKGFPMLRATSKAALALLLILVTGCGEQDPQTQYLNDFADEEGTVRTESGLLYQELESGDGPSPAAADLVAVHYRGTLVDGTEFDSSYARGEPAIFPVNRLIPGWVEALQLMQTGDRWKIVVPAELGYGAEAVGKIPPNATLVFEMELLAIKDQEEMREEQLRRREEIPQQNAEERQKFMQEQQDYLDENAKKDGVTITESGLQYRVLEAGEGTSPAPESMVTVHYAGSLIDGTEFDSSYKRGEPATFPANRLISGWVEALQLMREGDKWELVIPAELGYGAQGAGRDIPPGATLVFTVELISVG